MRSKIEDLFFIAQYLNHHVSTVADNTLQIKYITQTAPQENNLPELMLWPTTYKEVLEAIGSFKSKLSAGIHEISSILVKQCKEYNNESFFFNN